MKTHITLPLIALVAGLPVVCAQSTSGPTTTTPREDRERAAQTTPADRSATARAADHALDDDARELVGKLIRVSTLEVGLSRLAAENATHPEVKNFAQEMVAAHSSSLDELKTLLSGAPIAARDATFDERSWRTKKGNDFDKDYIDEMIDLHEDNDDLLEDAADSKHPQLTAYAGRHRPTVRMHLERAKALAKALD